MASMFVDVGGGKGGSGAGSGTRQREKIIELNGETLAVDSNNPWEYTYDRDGRQGTMSNTPPNPLTPNTTAAVQWRDLSLFEPARL